MATKKQTTESTKALVLVAGAYGKPYDIVVIAAADLDVALASGEVDTDAGAVAYGESLKAE